MGGVPAAIGAPSHTHGLSFTRKPQPMNNSSPRTFLTEAVVAASGPGGGWPGLRERWEEGRRGAAVQKTVKMVVDVPVSSTTSSRCPENSFWTCLSFSSSSEGGTFQLRRRDSAHSAHSTVRCSSWACCHACSRLAVDRRQERGAAGGLVCL